MILWKKLNKEIRHSTQYRYENVLQSEIRHCNNYNEISNPELSLKKDTQTLFENGEIVVQNNTQPD